MRRPTAKGENGPIRRDAKGRFVRGNPGGPGNPFARHTAALRRAVREVIGTPRLKKILLAMARNVETEGDVAAAKLLLSYVLGRPRIEQTVATLPLPEEITAATIGEISAEVLRAVAEGRISVEEGARLGGIVEATRRSLELTEIESRLQQVEAALGGNKDAKPTAT